MESHWLRVIHNYSLWLLEFWILHIKNINELSKINYVFIISGTNRRNNNNNTINNTNFTCILKDDTQIRQDLLRGKRLKIATLQVKIFKNK